MIRSNRYLFISLKGTSILCHLGIAKNLMTHLKSIQGTSINSPFIGFTYGDDLLKLFSKFIEVPFRDVSLCSTGHF